MPKYHGYNSLETATATIAIRDATAQENNEKRRGIKSFTRTDNVMENMTTRQGKRNICEIKAVSTENETELLFISSC